MNEEEITIELKKIKKTIAPLDKSKFYSIYNRIKNGEELLISELLETNKRVDGILKMLNLQFKLNQITHERIGELIK